LAGCADAEKTEHGQIVTVKDVDWDAPYSAAVTVTADCPLGVPVAAVTGNVAAEDAAGMLTVGGTVRAGLSLETATATPPAGAGPVRVMVQVPVDPAVRLVESQDTRVSSTGLRFKVAVAVMVAELFKPAMMVTVWLLVTTPALAVKVAESAPAVTGTDVGTVSRALSALSCTVLRSWASRLNLTVQVLEPPAANDVELQLRDDTACVSNTDKDAVWEEPFNAAVRITATLTTVVPAVAAKVAVMTPAGTVTVAGMVNTGLLSESVTTLPPDAAG
jgi:hypothetical protein